jgi:hypothetical protein
MKTSHVVKVALIGAGSLLAVPSFASVAPASGVEAPSSLCDGDKSEKSDGEKTEKKEDKSTDKSGTKQPA